MATTSVVTCPQCRTQISAGARFCGVCGKTMAPAPPPAPITADALVGRVIAGRYRVLSKLGAGGMGTVFRAEQTSVKRIIALKVLDPSMTMNPELLRRFQAEAEVVARLSHPNTVTLFDFGHDETGVIYIAMELVDGKSLRDVIAHEGPLAPHRAIDVAEQVASSLADAHAHGIVHRDLKPDNVILSERAGRRDFARVLDFGIAKLFDDPGGGGAAMTRAGQILGTPQYMAPEQITGRAVDGRTDVYALGVMLYEMLAGVPPFEGDNIIALLSKHMHDPPPPFGSVRPGLTLPMPVERMVLGCLAKDPAGRPADMRTLAAELGDLRSLLDPGPRRASAMGPAVSAPAFTPPPQPYLTPPPQPYLTPPPQPYATPPPQPYATPYGQGQGMTPGLGVVPGPAGTSFPAVSPLATPMSMMSPAAPHPRKGRGVLAALLVLGVAGAAVGMFFGVRAGLDGDDDGPEPAPAQGGQEEVAPTGPAQTYSSHQFGYRLELPAGLATREDTNTGGSITQGTYDRMLVSIAVVPVYGDVDADSRLEQLKQATGGSAQIVEQRTRRIRGTNLVSIVYDVQSAASRFETVFYEGSTPLAVTFAAPTTRFDDTAVFRDALFRDRFHPP